MKLGLFIIFFKIKRELEKIFVSSDDEVLDVGCGDRPFYSQVVKGKITTFDTKNSEITDVVGDASRLLDYFPDKKLAKIICVNALYQFSDPKEVIRQMYELLAQGGKLILVLPFLYPLHDIPYDRYRFSRYGIETLLEGKFSIELLKPFGGVFNLQVLILHALLKATSRYYKKIPVLSWVTALLLYILYFGAQIVSLLDFFDKSERFTCLYLVEAKKSV